MLLKIKKDKDLKELEKFGFTKGVCLYESGKDIYAYTKQVWVGEEYYKYVIYTDTRILYMYADEIYAYFCIDSTIYDLILAGLLEKVDD